MDDGNHFKLFSNRYRRKKGRNLTLGAWKELNTVHHSPLKMCGSGFRHSRLGTMDHEVARDGHQVHIVVCEHDLNKVHLPEVHERLDGPYNLWQTVNHFMAHSSSLIWLLVRMTSREVARKGNHGPWDSSWRVVCTQFLQVLVQILPAHINTQWLYKNKEI